MRKETTMTAPRMPIQTSHLSTDMNLKMDCSGSFFRSRMEMPDWSKYGATKSITFVCENKLDRFDEENVLSQFVLSLVLFGLI